jgi:hypothetical protein
MGLVTIAAGYSGSKHFTLLEGTVIIDFIQHLAVNVVQTTGQWRYDVSVGQPSPRYPILRELASPGVTQPARFYFFAQLWRLEIGPNVSRALIWNPAGGLALVELD